MTTSDPPSPTPFARGDSVTSENPPAAAPAQAEPHGEGAAPVNSLHDPTPNQAPPRGEVSAGDDPAGGSKKKRSSLGLRMATAFPAFGAVLALIVWGPGWSVAALVAMVSVLGIEEFRGLMRQGKGVRLPAFPLLGGAALIGLAGLSGEAALLGASLAAACLIYLFLVWLLPGGGGEQALDTGVYGLAGLVLVPWMLNHAPLLLTLPQGAGLLIFLLLAVSTSDSWAYLAGTFFGKTPLIPSISPKKTVEGALAGLVGGATAGLVAGLWLEGAATPLAGFIYWDLIAIGIVLALAAQCGDLLESKLKRLAQADDSGGVGLPGHGGVLDRADGYLIAGPLFYYYCALTLPW